METDLGASESYEPPGPKPIKKLSRDVVNQIAAAEVNSADAMSCNPLIRTCA